MNAREIHPYCEASCTHQRVPDLGGIIVQLPIDRDRAEAEAFLRETFFSGPRDQGLTDRLDYLGMPGEGDGRRHTWRIGGRAWRPMTVVRDGSDGEKGAREIKREHRPEVWLGSGEPVGPVDFSRPQPEPVKAFPAPVLTSTDEPARSFSGPASLLLAEAAGQGWEGLITQAEGHVPHATHGRPGVAAKFSEAVRLTRGAQRAVAVRMGGSWSSLWTWSPDQFFTRHSTLDAFKAALR